jgi:peptidoglycan/LPS O-acetylase OafA/YrhL
MAGYVIALGLVLRARLLRGPAFAADSQRVMALEGLRGVLATSVIFHHVVTSYYWHTTGEWRRPPSEFYAHLGYTSVALFFYLSGFLFWNKVRRAAIEPRRLWRDRLRRLAPAHLFAFTIVLSIIAAQSHFALRTRPAELLRTMLIWLAYGVPLVKTMFEANINDSGIMLQTYGVLWTLHFEWLFYLTLPGLAWLCARRKRWLGCVALLVAVAFCGAYAAAHEHDHTLQLNAAVEVTLFAAAFVVGFLPGILSTYLVRERVKSFARNRPWADLVVVSSLCGFVGLLPANGYPHYFLLIIPFTLIAAGNDVFGLLSSAPALLLGRISYSIYLLHLAVLFVASALLERWVPITSVSPWAYWLMGSAVGAATICLALVSFRFIEYPWLERPRAYEPGAAAEQGSNRREISLSASGDGSDVAS